MEEVDGISGLVPPLAIFPEESFRSSLAEAEWQACLDSWLLSLEFRLVLEDRSFAKFSLSQKASGIPFLLSYFQEQSRVTHPSPPGSKDLLLYRRTYSILKRLLLCIDTPYDFDPGELIKLVSLASLTYSNSSDWRSTLKAAWKRSSSSFCAGIEVWKSRLSKELLDHGKGVSTQTILRQLNGLVKCCSDAGVLLATGSDHFETLMIAYDSAETQGDGSGNKRLLTEHVFYCLRSAMLEGSQYTSLILDQVYFMKSDADRRQKATSGRSTLLSSLICSTSFLRHCASDQSVNATKRGQALIQVLKVYRQQNLHLNPPSDRPKRKVRKGKGRVESSSDLHVHKATQISQIHDLFPDLGNGYILRLLDHFQDNAESVIAALLEPTSLPEALREQNLTDNTTPAFDDPKHDLAPRSLPPLLPQRKNFFDGDDFDNLQISSNKLHMGRKNISLEDYQNADEKTKRKAAIMSALAAFDSDDDERDDSYDVADVGGTVDDTLDSDRRTNAKKQSEQDAGEETLFKAWQDNQAIFSRDTKTRISKVRQDLKRDTNMSDEQIEGWAIMLKRDAALQSRLERKYAAARSFPGNQKLIRSSRWQANTSEEESQDDSGVESNAENLMHENSHRGSFQPRGDRGGSTSSSRGASTPAARKRKEQGRGRGGANHGRREGRVKKMGRGMAG